MRASALAALLLAATFARAEPGVSVRTDHAEVKVGGERYRLVTGKAPLVVVLELDDLDATRRIILDVVRLGDETTDKKRLRGATPLVARVVGARQRVLPTRPRLVPERVVEGRDWIASYPVRYRMRLPRKRTVQLRVGLLRPASGGRVGVAVRFESEADQLAPLDGPIAARVIEGRTLPRRARRPRKPVAPPAPAPAPDPAPGLAPSTAPAPVTAPMTAPMTAAATEPVDAGPPPAPPAAKVRVVVDNRLKGPFRLVEHRLSVNDRLVADREAQRLPDRHEVFTGELEPGRHTLEATLCWTGEAGFLFTYLREYAFIVDASEELEVAPGDELEVRVVGYEHGGMFTDMLDKPAVRLEVTRR